MKIYYSPYFNGHAYIDFKKHGNGLLGECIESQAGLLARLELMCGLSYPEEDEDDKQRQETYYQALTKASSKNDVMKDSISNDSPEADPLRHLRVTTELLAWRDTLILAGWDRKTTLPEGKLRLLNEAEKELEEHSVVYRGTADRWLALSAKVDLLKAVKVEIYACCPKILVPKRIQDILSQLNDQPFAEEQDPNEKAALKPEHCQVFTFKEQYMAYEWLATQKPQESQLVICRDGERLDCVMRNFSKPVTSGDAKVGCHQVADDVRCQFDVPQSLIWLDCCGDLGYHYPYAFLSKAEKAELPFAIPDEQEILQQINAHEIRLLNAVPGQVTLVSCSYDNGQPLTEHPIVSALLHVAEDTGKKALTSTTPDIVVEKMKEQQEKRFATQMTYELGKSHSALVNAQAKMSYSALEKLVYHPFDYTMENEALLYEPYNNADLRTQEGTIAHKVVELMVNNGGIDVDEFDRFFDEALNTALKEKEENLLKEQENCFEKEEFQHMLKESLDVLAAIIRENGLKIVGSEYQIPQQDDSEVKKYTEFAPFGESSASIDLLLQDPVDGKYVIFDFKNSGSESYYPKKLEKNSSIQFLFYQHIFDEKSGLGKVKAYGYYLFPRHTLYVPEGEYGSNCLKGENVKPMSLGKEAIDNPYDRLKNSFAERMKELGNGSIEEAEGMELGNIEFHNLDSLFPLAGAYGNDKVKAGPYQPSHFVMKNQIR